MEQDQQHQQQSTTINDNRQRARGTGGFSTRLLSLTFCFTFEQFTGQTCNGNTFHRWMTTA